MIYYNLILVLFLGSLIACSSNAPTAQTMPAPAAKPQQLPAHADPSLVPPESVRLERVVFVNEIKNVTVSNSLGKYVLACSAKQDSCITPSPGNDYLLFNKNTKWKFNPDSKDYVTLEWLQGWSGTYNHGENIILLPSDGDRTAIGVFWLVSWNKGD